MMEIKEMSVEELEARKLQISTEVEAEDADLDALDAEIKSINAELEERKNTETKKAEIRQAVAQGNGVVLTESPEAEEKREMARDIAEVRNSKEYVDAYAEYLKTGNVEEMRSATALLTDTTGIDGEIAVPDFVYDIIKTAWDKNEIMSLVNAVELKGNLKVNFEISGSDAVVHTEGSGAVTEEELNEGIVTLVPTYVKKWKSFSDEVMSMRGEAFVRYIYDELAYRIMKKLADNLIGRIAQLPQTATTTSVSANIVKAAPAVGTVAAALGQLSDEAVNPVVVMNKQTWAVFKAAEYANGFSVDPFEGFAVHFNNSLPAYDTASADDVYAIVGDFGEGALVNFPNGQEIEYTFDQLTRKKEDLVEVLGKIYAGVAPVADKAFALITKPAGA
jgi:HK97 family phage major capsid protein